MIRVHSQDDPVRRAWHVVGVLLIALVIELSLTPHPIDIPIEHGDKYGHVLAYAVLMFWYAQIVSARMARFGVAAAFVAMAIALEFVQRATGYRSFEVQDMEAGAIGVLLGWVLAPPRSPSLIDCVRTLRPLGRP